MSWPCSRRTRLRTLFGRRDLTGRPDMPMLSVYRDYGVTPRDGRDDNYNKPGEDLSVYRVVRRGDLVLNKMKTWQGSLGISDYEGIVSPAYFVARPLTNDNPAFLHHLLRSPLLIAEYGARSKGIRPSQWDLPWDEFRDITVELPQLPAQRAIADFLDRETARIDALVAAKLRMVELLEERRQVVIHDASAGRLALRAGERRSTSVPWLTDVPSHWREGHLKLVAKLGTGHTPSRSHPEWWVDLTIPWITTGEVAQMRSDRIEYITETREQISEAGMANSSATLHPAGTVVLCRTASAGYSAIMGRDMATSQDFATWTCGPLLRPRFLLLCLRAMRQDLLGRLAMGSTHKTIYMPDIEAIKVPVPPIEEQDVIVSAASSQQHSLEACLQRLHAQINLLQERRRTLITAAVTGEVDVSEAA
jgi:type I restriction enzyme, S subunit